MRQKFKKEITFNKIITGLCKRLDHNKTRETNVKLFIYSSLKRSFQGSLFSIPHFRWEINICLTIVIVGLDLFCGHLASRPEKPITSSLNILLCELEARKLITRQNITKDILILECFLVPFRSLLCNRKQQWKKPRTQFFFYQRTHVKRYFVTPTRCLLPGYLISVKVLRDEASFLLTG